MDNNDNSLTPKSKFKKPLILGIIAIFIAVISIFINKSNISSVSSKVKVINAFKNTVTMSLDEVLNNFEGISYLQDLMDSKNYTVNIDINAEDLFENLELSLQHISKDEESQFKIKYLEQELFNFYTDKNDILLKFEDLDDNVYKIDYEELIKSDLSFIKLYLNYQDYENALQNLRTNITQNAIKILNKVDFEELGENTHKLNNENVTVEAYSFKMSVGAFFDLLESTFEIIKNDKEFKEAWAIINHQINSNYYDYDYTLDETLEMFEQDIDTILNEINYIRSEFSYETSALSEDSTIISLDAYLYQDYIVKAQLKIWDIMDSFYYDTELDFYNDEDENCETFLYEANGGSHPLEDATFTHNYLGETTTIYTIGSNYDEGIIFSAYNEDGFEIFYLLNQKTNNKIYLDIADSAIQLVIAEDTTETSQQELYVTADIFSDFSLGLSLSSETDEIERPVGNEVEVDISKIKELAESVLEEILPY